MLRTDEHGICARLMGWENVTQEADALNLEVSTVYRVLSGQSAPGPRFMANLLAVLAPYGVKFERVFALVPEAESTEQTNQPRAVDPDTALQRSA